MGIVKIRHQGAASKNQDQQSNRRLTVNGPIQEKRLLAGNDAADDSDDSDPADFGCELAMVGDQMCSIPYDLYDLSGLKDILSLESWNSCLSKEERFHLASYLPDMDRETFVLTIKELLGGENLSFGSPLQRLFHRLKGGFYSLRVPPVRDGLRFLQKQGHCHSLRLYHESMIQKFAEMSTAWSDCPPCTTVEEKVRIWNDRRSRKPVLLVDLNAFPADEETGNKGEKMVGYFPLLKKTKYVDECLNRQTPANDLDTVAVSMKLRGKGVLKVRSAERNATPNQRMQALPSDNWEPYKQVPKGVLKIKPKTDSFTQLERPMKVPVHVSSGLLDTHASTFSSPLYASKCHEENAGQKLTFLHQRDSDEYAKINLEQPEQLNDGKKEACLKTGAESFSDQHGFPRKMKAAFSSRFYNASELHEGTFPLKGSQRSRMQSNEATGIALLCKGGNMWRNLDEQSSVICTNSSESDLFVPKNQQNPTATLHADPREMARTSSFGTSPRCFEHPEHKHKDTFDGELGTTSDSTAVSEVKREIIFPITYKRKKACTKFSPLESPKQPSIESTECNLTGKAKTVKIKVKGWHNRNAQNYGLLNGLRHGSPST